MVIVNQCTLCAHLQGFEGDGGYCSAFPDGIPDAIFSNEFDHRAEYPGDNGIRFLAKTADSDLLQREMLTADDEYL
jgi:hypothetical protein